MGVVADFRCTCRGHGFEADSKAGGTVGGLNVGWWQNEGGVVRWGWWRTSGVLAVDMDLKRTRRRPSVESGAELGVAPIAASCLYSVGYAAFPLKIGWSQGIVYPPACLKSSPTMRDGGELSTMACPLGNRTSGGLLLFP